MHYTIPSQSPPSLFLTKVFGENLIVYLIAAVHPNVGIYNGHQLKRQKHVTRFSLKPVVEMISLLDWVTYQIFIWVCQLRFIEHLDDLYTLKWSKWSLQLVSITALLPGEVAFSICMFNVQPNEVIWDVMLIKALVDSLYILLIIIVPAALMIRQRRERRKRLSA